MPEAVEVFLSAKFIENNVLGKNIIKIKIIGGRYLKSGVPGIDEFKKILPAKVESVDSKGKFLYIKFPTLYLASTLGLTGSWGNKKVKHSAICMYASDGTKLYYSDQLRYGTLSFVDYNYINKKLSALADDVLVTVFTDNDFIHKLSSFKNKTKNIVTVLMEQKNGPGIFSGIGNYLSAEILYHARVSPFSTIEGLLKDKNVCKKLAKSIRYITKFAFYYSYTGYMTGLDQSFVKNIRKVKKDIHPDINLDKGKTFEFNVYGQKFDQYKNPVEGAKIIKGRTSYWCPTLQELYI